jgi:glucose/arabinose dehydrogenase
LTAIILCVLLAVPAVSGCDDDAGSPGDPGAPDTTTYDYELTEAFPGVSFTRPIDLQHAGDGTDRLFVVEQAGVIKVFVNADTVSTAKTFLDISSRTTFIGERGLLGLAFHPDYATNGYFFVYYSPSATGGTRVSRFEASAGDPDDAEEGSEFVLMDIAQDYPNHNGGQIAFGPDDYLYIAVGDEGLGGDPKDNAQDLTTLHGSILRIDVDSQGAGNYGIPPTNPFFGNPDGFREEIYAYGLRNPWRFSFDPVTDLLWAGDVGQGSWEEIDIIVSGGNYGWDCREGMHTYNTSQQSAVCDTVQGLIDPVWEYQNAGDDISVTGGHVYRGPTATSLVGDYIYADYGSARVWALTVAADTVASNFELSGEDPTLRISSFGVDEQNELYICGYIDGKIYMLRQTAAAQ